MTPNELFAKELMTYDVGTDSHSSFYNNLPYVKDYDLCNWRPLRMNSGNITALLHPMLLLPLKNRTSQKRHYLPCQKRKKKLQT